MATNLPAKQKLKWEFIIDRIFINFRKNIFKKPLFVKWYRNNKKVHKRNKYITTKPLEPIKFGKHHTIEYLDPLKIRFALIFDPKIKKFVPKTTELKIISLNNKKEETISNEKIDLSEFIETDHLRDNDYIVMNRTMSNEAGIFLKLKMEYRYMLNTSLNENFFKLEKYFLSENDYYIESKLSEKCEKSELSLENIKKNNNEIFVDGYKNKLIENKNMEIIDRKESKEKNFKGENGMKTLKVINRKEKKVLKSLLTDFYLNNFKISNFQKEIKISKKTLENYKEKHKNTINLEKKYFVTIRKDEHSEITILQKLYFESINIKNELNNMIDLEKKDRKLKYLNKEIEKLHLGNEEFEEANKLIEEKNKEMEKELNSFERQKSYSLLISDLKGVENKLLYLKERILQEKDFRKVAFDEVRNIEINLKEKEKFVEGIERELVEKKMELLKYV